MWRKILQWIMDRRPTKVYRVDEMSELEASLKDAVLCSIQTGVGQNFHPDATTIICIAFRTTIGAEKFKKAYVEKRYELEGLIIPKCSEKVV